MQYLAGRRFTLMTECSALTGLFCSRDVSPKLHLWALGLRDYDIILYRRPDTYYYMPEAFSRLPRTGAPKDNTDDAFSDDHPSSNPAAFAGHRGTVPDDGFLDYLTPAGIEGHHTECLL